MGFGIRKEKKGVANDEGWSEYGSLCDPVFVVVAIAPFKGNLREGEIVYMYCISLDDADFLSCFLFFIQSSFPLHSFLFVF